MFIPSIIFLHPPFITKLHMSSFPILAVRAFFVLLPLMIESNYGIEQKGYKCYDHIPKNFNSLITWSFGNTSPLLVSHHFFSTSNYLLPVFTNHSIDLSHESFDNVECNTSSTNYPSSVVYRPVVCLLCSITHISIPSDFLSSSF